MQRNQTGHFFQESMEVVDEWLATGPKQMAIAIKELLNASKDQKDPPEWSTIHDMEIRMIAQEQWFLSNIIIMWGSFHKSWNEIVKRHLVPRSFAGTVGSPGRQLVHISRKNK